MRTTQTLRLLARICSTVLTRLSLCTLLVVSLLIADAAGRWTGNVTFIGRDGEKVPGTVLLVLKQDGKIVSGTAGPNDESQKAIQNGKIEDGVITFTVEIHEGTLMSFKLKQAGDEITGDISTEHDNQKMKASLSVTRQR